MALAMEREPTAFRSLLMRPGTVLADPGALIARLVRGWFALAVGARVRALIVASTSERFADTFRGRQLSRLALAMEREPTAFRSLLVRPGGGPGRP